MKLDLGESKVVEKLELVGRAGDEYGTHSDQSSGWTIRVGDHGDFSDQVCKSSVDVSGGRVESIQCDNRMVGRYVTITSSRWMVLCEATVFGPAGRSFLCRIGAAAHTPLALRPPIVQHECWYQY